MNESNGDRALFLVRKLEARVAELERESHARSHGKGAIPRGPKDASEWAVPNDYVSGSFRGLDAGIPAQKPRWTTHEEEAFRELEAKARSSDKLRRLVVAEPVITFPYGVDGYTYPERPPAEEAKREAIRPSVEVSPGEAEREKVLRGWQDRARVAELGWARARIGIREAIRQLRECFMFDGRGSFFARGIADDLAALLENDGAARGGDCDPLPEPAELDPALAIGSVHVSNSNGRFVLRDESGRIRFRGDQLGMDIRHGTFFPVALPPEDSGAPGEDAEKAR